MENLNLPIGYINSFVKSIGITNQYSAENVLEENTTLILGMLWSLILRFNVSSITEGDRTAKEGLLLWVQRKVEDVAPGLGGKVANFHTNWQDGVAFNALVNAYKPGLVDMDSLDPNAHEHNLKTVPLTASHHRRVARGTLRLALSPRPVL